MNFEKQKALNLLEKWDQEKIKDLILNTLRDCSLINFNNRVAFKEACSEYFNELKNTIKKSKSNDLDDIFDEIERYSTLSIIAINNAHIYDFSLDEYALDKIDYMLKKYKDGLEEWDTTETREILYIADGYILTDFLRWFSYKVKRQFKKEYQLENDK